MPQTNVFYGGRYEIIRNLLDVFSMQSFFLRKSKIYTFSVVSVYI